ncbi:hypothetical protein, partial [Streptomyces scabiei]|uniref:hypothetical protein n=1 Tax=Streptomyces scabiei TaxID=1930 RepID=UPI0029A01C92
MPEPKFQPVAVALAQRAQIVERAPAVGALQLAPDVEDDDTVGPRAGRGRRRRGGGGGCLLKT